MRLPWGTAPFLECLRVFSRVRLNFFLGPKAGLLETGNQFPREHVAGHWLLWVESVPVNDWLANRIVALESFLVHGLSVHPFIHARTQGQLHEALVTHLELRPGYAVLAVGNHPAKAEVLVHREIEGCRYDSRSNDAVRLA